MSIQDNDGGEIIHLNSIWSMSFKLLMLLVPFVALTLFSWGTWVTLTIFDHSTTLRILEDRHGRPGNNGGGNINGASINVSKAIEDLAQTSGRKYLTVKEVAEREDKDERTITLWIEHGRIHPSPVKAGKAWTIAEDYRVLPQITENSGIPEMNATQPE